MTAPAEIWLVMAATAYRARLQASLESHRCTVTPLLAAEAVLTKLNYARPDAIVFEADLPGMRLFEAARWVKEGAGDASPMVFAVVDSRHEEREASATAVDVVVRRPSNAASLALQIRVQLDTTREFRQMLEIRRAIYGNPPSPVATGDPTP
jgi:DNA-binding response OmpR family regulator